MQIISELEGYRRGPYGGAVGYALPDGDLDTCIAIRTIVLHDGVAHLQAGAGIVADSEPNAEHEECLRKLAALERAITLAEAMILLVDNYDSFTYNLVHLFQELGRRGRRAPERRDRRRRGRAAAPVASRRLPRARAARGFGRDARDRPPARADDARRSASASATRRSSQAFGGEIGQARELVHGKATEVSHDGRGIFAGLPQPFQAGRYHSLAATSVPERARGLGDEPPTAR